jgi:hypothetical protein
MSSILPIRIGLTQYDTKLLGELHQLLTGFIHEFGVGRVSDVFGLHGGVDHDAREIAGLHGAGSGRDRQALLQQRLQPFLTHAIAPVRHR